MGHPAGDLWHAVVVSGVATVAALSLAINQLGRREPHIGGSGRARARRSLDAG